MCRQGMQLLRRGLSDSEEILYEHGSHKESYEQAFPKPSGEGDSSSSGGGVTSRDIDNSTPRGACLDSVDALLKNLILESYSGERRIFYENFTWTHENLMTHFEVIKENVRHSSEWKWKAMELDRVMEVEIPNLTSEL